MRIDGLQEAVRGLEGVKNLMRRRSGRNDITTSLLNGNDLDAILVADEQQIRRILHFLFGAPQTDVVVVLRGHARSWHACVTVPWRLPINPLEGEENTRAGDRSSL